MPRKILEEMRLTRAEDGAHVVTHHHAEHKSETHRFSRSTQAVQHIISNIHRLEPKGLPHPEIEEQGESELNSWAGGRSASFGDSGSRGSGEVSGRRK